MNDRASAPLTPQSLARTALEAEQAVIGSMMLDNEAIERVASIVRVADFNTEGHREIVECIAGLRECGIPIDPITLGDALERAGKLRDAGGLPYLAQIFDNTPTAANAEFYAKIVAERAQQRKLADSLPTDARETALPLIWARDAGPMLDVGYVVKYIVGRGELFVIYGPPKSGKTFFATDLGLCVASGREWFGHRVKPGLVVYVAAEMGHRAQRRVRAWLERHLGDEANVDVPFAIVPRAVNLLDEVEVERLFATLNSLVAERGQPVLILVDTLSRSMVGGDENAAQDMGRVVGVGDRLRDTFNAATGLVHHSGKDANKGHRGSSVLLGAADAFIRVESDEQGNRAAEVEWSRDGESGQKYGFRLQMVDMGIDADGDRITSCVLAAGSVPVDKPKTVRRDVALDALREAISEHGEPMPGTSTIPKGVKAVRLEVWKARWALRTGYEESRSADANFAKDKRALLESGKVAISKPFVWLTS
ncbi:MAG: AAA family ATPase [Pseudomonadota bacterium]|nr:AAA family ATPase [Pseudomonadota bacterium]